jgi:two-component system sensor histidine kinase AgrC
MKGAFLWSIYEYLLSLIEVLLFYDFLHYTIKRNIKIKNAYHILSMILLSILIFVLTQINIYSMLRTIIMYVIFLLIAYKMFMGNLKEKFLFVTVFYFFLIFTDILAVNIISYFVGRDIKDIIINQTWARMIFSQISKLLLFIILKIIKDDYKGRKTEIPVHYWYWILFVYLISVLNLLVIFYISMVLNDYDVDMQYLMVVISLGSLLIVGMTYYIFIKLNEFYRERSNYKIIEIKNELLTKGIREKEKVYREIRRINHDFKNHIICIENLLKEDKHKLAIDYIRDLKNEAFETYTWIKTGNDVVDAILNQKRSEGNSKNIKMNMKVSIPKDINMEPLDLCTILGNALDNSIEANEKIEDISRRYINVIMNPYKDYLFIEISNPSIFNPIGEDGKLRTTKKDKENHGFGIKSIKQVVEKYDGMLNYEYQDGQFILNIMLPFCEEAYS